MKKYIILALFSVSIYSGGRKVIVVTAPSTRELKLDLIMKEVLLKPSSIESNIDKIISTKEFMDDAFAFKHIMNFKTDALESWQLKAFRNCFMGKLTRHLERQAERQRECILEAAKLLKPNPNP